MDQINYNSGDELQRAIDEIANSNDFSFQNEMEKDSSAELEKVFAESDVMNAQSAMNEFDENKKEPQFLTNEPNTQSIVNNEFNEEIKKPEVDEFGQIKTGSEFGQVRAENEFEVGSGDVKKMIETENKDLNDFSRIKKEMLLELFPLMDKIQVGDNQKFRIYKEILEETGNKEVIGMAYGLVKKFSDEKEKAEALMYLLEKLS